MSEERLRAMEEGMTGAFSDILIKTYRNNIVVAVGNTTKGIEWLNKHYKMYTKTSFQFLVEFKGEFINNIDASGLTYHEIS
jgi:hypothetical protein